MNADDKMKRQKHKNKYPRGSKNEAPNYIEIKPHRNKNNNLNAVDIQGSKNEASNGYNELEWQRILQKKKEEFDKKYAKPGGDESSLQKWERIRTLGTGAFGRVILVKSRESEEYAAVKIMEKAKVVKLQQVEHTLTEKRILGAVDFPFLIYMVTHFKDNSNLYLVLQFVCGGEMFSYLRKQTMLSEEESRFHAAQVVLALEYLQKMDVAYRDLKPENMLICSTGFIKLTDFGFAKRVRGRMWTLCGTPEYIAPEILLSKGYNKSVDWWALGVLIYEMTAGHPPFFSDSTIKTYEKIVIGDVKFPQHFSPNLKDLVRGFLQVNLSRRLGNLRGGALDVRGHKWFSDVDWLAVYHQKVTPPYSPPVSGPGDASHFEDFEEEPIVYSTINKFDKEFEGF